MLTLARRAYRALLWLYPAAFRREYAADMMRDFMALADETRRAGGSVLWLVLRTAVDTVRVAAREHRGGGYRRNRGRPMLGASTGRAQGVELMRTMVQDIRYSVRTLAQHPTYTTAAALTLALGIGANTAIFSVVNGVLLEPLPYQEGDRLVVIEQHRAGGQNRGFSVQEIAEYRELAATLDEVVEYHSLNFVLLAGDEPERVQSGVVSWQFFQTLGVQPLLGRVFAPGDDVPGAEPVLVLSHRYWRRRFGGDPAVVGQTVRMNDKVHTIVGVLPPVPHYPRENDVYMPTVACPFRSGPGWIDNRGVRGLAMFSRLAPGVPEERVETEMSGLARRMREEYPRYYPQQAGGHRVEATRLKEQLVRDARPMLVVLMGTVGLVLLIACANVANLTLARLFRREREIAVRAALGAGRLRLTRQLMTESTLLTVLGGGLGIALAVGGLDLLVGFIERFTPRAREIDIDGTVLLFTLVVSVGTGLLFGALPALPSGRDLAAALREAGTRTTAGLAKLRLRSALVVSQLAVSFMLLIGAGLAVRSFINLYAVDAGVRTNDVLTGTIAVAFSSQVDPVQFTDALLREVNGLPGVTSAAVTTTFPLDQATPFSNAFEVEGRPVADSTMRPIANFRRISPRYFETIGQPLLRGRVFTETDGEEEMRPVIIVNEALVRNHFEGEDPIGKRVRAGIFGSDPAWFTIVGVVGNVKQRLDGAIEDEIYFPFRYFPFTFNRLLVRAAGDPWGLVTPIREVLRRLDPETPLEDLRTLEQVRSESLASPRLTAVLLGLFGALALTITATGIAGVIGFSVSQRRNELGLRMALGARRQAVLWMVLRQGMRLVLVGLGVGAMGAVALTRVLSGVLFGVEATDPLTFAGVALVLAGVAALATLVPARRATNIDPVKALRAE